MKIGLFTPFAPPQRSAVVTRFTSLRTYLVSKGLEADFISPAELKTHEENSPNYVKYYTNIMELIKIIKCYDLLVITTPPGNYAFKAILISKLLKKRVIVDIRDPWTFAQEKLNLIDNGSLKYKKQILMEKLTYRIADKITIVTEYLKEYLIDKFSFLKEKDIIVAPNGVEPSNFKYNIEDRKEARTELNIPKDATVLTYMGIIGGKELDELLKLAQPLLRDNVKLYLMFILIVDKWSESLLSDLKKLAKELGILERLVIMESVEHEKVSKYLSASDIAINPLPNNLNYCFPVKTFEYMSNELFIAVKGPKEGPLYDLTINSSFGFYAESWDEFYIKLNKILSTCTNEDIKSLGLIGKEVVQKSYKREMANIKIYETLLELGK